MGVNQKKGHWIIDSYSDREFVSVRCSECGFSRNYLGLADMANCPVCLVDMTKSKPERTLVLNSDNDDAEPEDNTKYLFTVTTSVPVIEDRKIVRVITAHNGNVYDNVEQAESDCLKSMITCIRDATKELNMDPDKICRDLHSLGCPMYMVMLDGHSLWYSVDPLEYKTEEDSKDEYVK